MRVPDRLFVRAPAALLAVCLVLGLVVPVPVYAGEATATPSDVYYDLYGLDPPDSGYYDADVADEGIMLYDLYQSVPKFKNTVSFDGVYVQFAYNTTQGGLRWLGYQKVSSDGHVTLQRPSNYASLYCMEIQILRSSLPPTGKYALSLNILPSTGITYRSINNIMDLTSRSTLSNSGIVQGSISHYYSGDHEGTSFDNGHIITNSYSFDYGECAYDSGGDFYSHLNDVQVYNYSSTYLMYTIYFSSASPASMPLSLDLRIAFSPSYGTPTYTMVNRAPTSSEALDDISGTVGDIASGVNEVSTGIGNVVSGISSVAQGITNLPSKIAESLEPHYADILTQLHHITEQLHALWDQLAAYFNDHLIPQMITDTDRIVTAIENIDLQVDVHLDEITSTLNKNHKEQLHSDESIHSEEASQAESMYEDLKNGYSTGAYESNANKLEDSLQKYESQESELLSDVQDNIDGFTYVNPFLQFTAPLDDLSYFLTGIYNGLGALNIPIAFSLTLTIALICIGWYRFKGG